MHPVDFTRVCGQKAESTNISLAFICPAIKSSYKNAQ